MHCFSIAAIEEKLLTARAHRTPSTNTTKVKLPTRVVFCRLSLATSLTYFTMPISPPYFSSRSAVVGSELYVPSFSAGGR